MLNRIYERESTEQVKFSSIIGEILGEISHNDQLLLKLMDQETIKERGHYAVPLPLRSMDDNLPNNSVSTQKTELFAKKFLH